MAKKILLVDDTETVIMFEKMMLAGKGYDIMVARNGVEALKMVQQIRPDMILLDIVMPKKDGIEVCRELKNHPDTQDIPIVMVTTKGEPERVDQAFRAGCDDYITKPLEKMKLISKVENYIN